MGELLYPFSCTLEVVVVGNPAAATIHHKHRTRPYNCIVGDTNKAPDPDCSNVLNCNFSFFHWQWAWMMNSPHSIVSFSCKWYKYYISTKRHNNRCVQMSFFRNCSTALCLIPLTCTFSIFYNHFSVCWYYYFFRDSEAEHTEPLLYSEAFTRINCFHTFTAIHHQ